MKPFDIQLLLVDLAIILVLARVFGLLARRIGQPQVLGEIVAGLLLGPTLFGGAITRHLLPPDIRPGLSALADIGLVLFMFIIGYELDRELIRGRERIAITVSVGSVALPMVLGFLLGLWLATRHAEVDRVVPFALFIGASMSVTAFPVLARILTDRGLHRTRIGGLAVASAAADDILAWVLLAVVVTIAGSHGGTEWHLALAPVYLAVMYFGARPLMAWVGQRYNKIGRLTPDLLAIVLIGLLLSAYATDWLGVHFIFGGFVFGTVMPRGPQSAALRESILERLEQISVLLLLPVFFVVSGIAVNLSDLDGRLIVELLLILAVAIIGKGVGAYLAGLWTGLGPRHAAVLGTLMNTRGLTQLVILSVGLQLHVLPDSLFSLMVVMALVTTAMTGPLLGVLYPKRLIERDLADAERAALAGTASYRVLAVVNSLENTDLVDTAISLAAARPRAEVLLVRLVPQRKSERLEVGSGLGSELLVMTRTLAQMHELAGRGASRGVAAAVHAKFSEGDLAGDLTSLIIEVGPDAVVLDAETELAPHHFMPRIVRQKSPTPADATEIVLVQRSGGGADAAAALQTAAELSVGRGLHLVLAGQGGGRRDRPIGDLSRHGISAAMGEVGDHSIVVGSVDAAGMTLVAQARPDEEAFTVDDWAGSLTAAESTAADPLEVGR